jgi:hypothetical protein
MERFRLTKGTRVKDLPDDFRCAFNHFPGSCPNVGYQNGQFCEIEWMECESYWNAIPWDVDLIFDPKTGSVYPERMMPMSAKNQLKIAEIAMNPKGYGFAGKLAPLYTKRLIWC